MATETISIPDLPEADALTGDEMVIVVQGGVTKRSTVSAILSVSPGPLIILSETTLDFPDTNINDISSSQTVTVSGSNLVADIIFTAPAGFIANLDNSADDQTPITLTETSGTVSDTIIYLSFAPTIEQVYDSTASATSTSAITKTLELTGTGLPAASFDIDAQAFLTAAGIPNNGTVYFPGTPAEKTAAQHCTAINNLVLKLKGANSISHDFWSNAKFKYLRPYAGDSAGSRAVNLSNPGTYDIAFQGGGWTHGYRGSYGDGIASYADSGLKPDDTDMADVCFGRFNGGNICASGDSNITGCDLGASGIFQAHGWAIKTNFQGSLVYTIDDVNGFFTPDNSGVGCYSVNVPNATDVQVFVQGVLADSNTQTSSLFIGNHNIYLNAMNKNGVPVEFSQRELQSDWCIQSLSAPQQAVLNQILFEYNQELGRVYKELLIFGDSNAELDSTIITMPSYRWTRIISSYYNCLEVNNGVNSTTLEHTTPNTNVLAAPNMYDLRTSVTAYTDRIGGIIIEHGINDTGINISEYNTTTYGTQDASIIDEIHLTKGFPLNKIFKVGGFFVTSVGWGHYPTFTGGLVTVPADNTRYQSFLTQIQTTATAKGILFVNCYSDMAANGGTSLLNADELHLNNAGCARVAVNNCIPAFPIYL